MTSWTNRNADKPTYVTSMARAQKAAQRQLGSLGILTLRTLMPYCEGAQATQSHVWVLAVAITSCLTLLLNLLGPQFIQL